MTDLHEDFKKATQCERCGSPFTPNREKFKVTYATEYNRKTMKINGIIKTEIVCRDCVTFWIEEGLI